MDGLDWQDLTHEERIARRFEFHATGAAPFPSTYTSNDIKEDIVLEYARRFEVQYSQLFPSRSPLRLCPPNEANQRKFISTYLKPTNLRFPPLYDYDTCSAFLSSYCSYEILSDPYSVPRTLTSPSTTLFFQRGNSFDLSLVYASLFLGSGYDAYVVCGYASESVTSCQVEKKFGPRAWESKLQEDEPEVVEEVPVRKYVLKRRPVLEVGYEWKEKSEDQIVSEVLREEEARKRKKRKRDLRRRSGSSLLEDLDGGSAGSVDRIDEIVNGGGGAEGDEGEGDFADDEISRFLGRRKRESRRLRGEGRGDFDETQAPALAPAPAPAPPRRVHAWVLVLPGKRGIETAFFVEPSTGESKPTIDKSYEGIELVFNDKNLWVNMQQVQPTEKELLEAILSNLERESPEGDGDGDGDGGDGEGGEDEGENDDDEVRDEAAPLAVAGGDADAGSQKKKREEVIEIGERSFSSSSSTVSSLSSSSAETAIQKKRRRRRQRRRRRKRRRRRREIAAAIRSQSQPIPISFDLRNGQFWENVFVMPNESESLPRGGESLAEREREMEQDGHAHAHAELADGGMSAVSAGSGVGVGASAGGGALYAIRGRDVLDLPLSWVSRLRLTRAQFQSRFPRQERRVRYRNLLKEEFAQYHREDLMTMRVTVFSEGELDSEGGLYTNPTEMHRFFERRGDRLKRHSKYFAVVGTRKAQPPIEEEEEEEGEGEGEFDWPHRADASDESGIGNSLIREVFVFDRRTHDALREISIEENQTSYRFYPEMRLDGLSGRIELTRTGETPSAVQSRVSRKQKIVTTYEDRDDRLVSRSITFDATKLDAFRDQLLAEWTVEDHDGERRVNIVSANLPPLPDVLKKSETFSRNPDPSVPAHRDIERIVYLRTRHLVYYHYGDGKITRMKKVYEMPGLGLGLGAGPGARSLTHQGGENAMYVFGPDPHELHGKTEDNLLERERLRAREKTCTEDIRTERLELVKILARRQEEESNLTSVTTIYDTLRNRPTPEEEEDMEIERRREEERKKALKDRDVLAYYIPKGGIRNAAHAEEIYTTILAKLRDRLLKRAEILSKRLKSERETMNHRNQEFQKRQQEVAEDGARPSEDEYLRVFEDSLFRLNILIRRARQNRVESSREYAAMQEKLVTDPRLRPFLNEVFVRTFASEPF